MLVPTVYVFFIIGFFFVWNCIFFGSAHILLELYIFH